MTTLTLEQASTIVDTALAGIQAAELVGDSGAPAS
jgi:hypothetical protein